MFKENLNLMEVRSLLSLTKGPCNMTRLADVLGTGKTWVSKCISHLDQMGFIRVERVGRRSKVSISTSPLGNAMTRLVVEDPLLNLEMVLTGDGLRLLVMLLPPGMTVKEMAARSGLTSRTIRGYVRKWRKLGVVQKQETLYSLHRFHGQLIEFIRTYCEHRNISFVKEISPEAVLVWQDRDEFILSGKMALSGSGLIYAGPSALSRSGEDIVYSNRYYLYSVVRRKVSREEAYIQALMIDPAEPRIRRGLLRNLKDGQLVESKLRTFAERYDIVDLLTEVIRHAG